MLSSKQVQTAETILFEIAQDTKNPASVRASAAKFLLTRQDKWRKERLKAGDTDREDVAVLKEHRSSHFEQYRDTSISELKKARSGLKKTYKDTLKLEKSGEFETRYPSLQDGKMVSAKMIQQEVKERIDILDIVIEEKKQLLDEGLSLVA